MDEQVFLKSAGLSSSAPTAPPVKAAAAAPAMNRPVLNPAYLDEHSAPPPRQRWLMPLLRRALSGLGRVAFYSPFRSRDRAERDAVELSWGTRLVRGLIYRLLFAPVVIMLVAWALVFQGTHSPRRFCEQDPSSQGVYYDPVTFLTDDGVRLEGWLVPVLEAREVLEKRERALRQKHPAVILMPDQGQSRQQLLPLVQPLHDAGFIVLVVEPRGGGGGMQTFGLQERLDVKAGVEMLRRRPYVDGKKLAVVGTGSGANAAILAAHDDPTIAALVLQGPVRESQQVVEEHLLMTMPGLSWMQPVCKWTFELWCRVDIEELDYARHREWLSRRSALLLEAPGIDNSIAPSVVLQVRDYLAATLDPQAPEQAAAAAGERLVRGVRTDVNGGVIRR